MKHVVIRYEREPAAAMSRPMAEVPALTGLRGVAAVLVVVFHFEQSSGFSLTGGASPAAGVLRTFISHGYLWVDLFFSLSGFVISRAYAQRFERRISAWEYRAFLLARFARLYPLYLAVILAVGVYFAAEGAQSWALAMPERALRHPVLTVAANLVMVQMWGVSASINSPSWSVSVEWVSYIVFPVAVHALAPSRFGPWVLGCACIAAILVLGLQAAPELPRAGPLDFHDYFTARSIIRCTSGFFLGALASRFYRAGSFGVLAGMVPAGVLAVVILTAMALPRADVVVVLLFPLLIGSLAMSQRGIVQSALRTTVIYTSGRISYSIYLLHDQFHWLRPLVEIGTPPAWGGGCQVISLAVTIVAVWVCAWVAYTCIERPGRRRVLDFCRLAGVV